MKHGTLAIASFIFFLVLNAGAAESSRPLVSLFPEMEGWLYERIDGAAENFLSYGFLQLATQAYGNDQKQFLSAEIYFHGTLENAFGIYSSEKPLTGNYLPVGGQGYAEEGIFNFFSDAYYIKLNSFGLGPEGSAVLAALAEKIARAIGAENTLPKILEAFPSAGKHIESERFILNNFLGHDFLHSAYVVDYRVDKQNFQLFLIQAGSEGEARAMLEKYAALDKGKPGLVIQSPKGTDVAAQPPKGTGATAQPHKGTDVAAQPIALIIHDPYNGPIQLLWQGKFICGSASQSPAAAGHMAALAGNLAKQ
jgi:hypothetical protein